MTKVSTSTHPNTNAEILRDLRGRSNNTKQQEWLKQNCILLSQGLLKTISLPASAVYFFGAGLYYSSLYLVEGACDLSTYCQRFIGEVK